MIVILYWVVKGIEIFKEHDQFSSRFAFNAKMVGFTKKGEVKIWLNECFHKFELKNDVVYHSHVLEKVKVRSETQVKKLEQNR